MRISDWSSDVCSSDWPCRGAGDPPVVVAVEEIVPGAAGAAHDQRSHREQNEEQDYCTGRGGRRRRDGEGAAPPAGTQQQPCADRPVPPVEPEIGPRSERRPAVDPSAGRDVARAFGRSEENTSERQSLMRTSYAVFL